MTALREAVKLAIVEAMAQQKEYIGELAIDGELVIDGNFQMNTVTDAAIAAIFLAIREPTAKILGYGGARHPDGSEGALVVWQAILDGFAAAEREATMSNSQKVEKSS